MLKTSFKERILTELLNASRQYKKVYLDYEYLIFSEAFKRKDYYIISAEKDNFKHLTGVNSKINAKDFFEKCYNGSLSDNDFDFIKIGQDLKSVKGTIRRKISVLPDMMNLFHANLLVEENYIKNHVICSFATADGSCTLGFIESGKSRPKSLIKGNALHNPSPVNLILRRKRGTTLFNEIITGDITYITKHRDKIQTLVTNDLLSSIPLPQNHL